MVRFAQCRSQDFEIWGYFSSHFSVNFSISQRAFSSVFVRLDKFSFTLIPTLSSFNIQTSSDWRSTGIKVPESFPLSRQSAKLLLLSQGIYCVGYIGKISCPLLDKTLLFQNIKKLALFRSSLLYGNMHFFKQIFHPSSNIRLNILNLFQVISNKKKMALME